jgi:hypothetical protein
MHRLYRYFCVIFFAAFPLMGCDIESKSNNPNDKLDNSGDSSLILHHATIPGTVHLSCITP